jgi:AcrR family transcriptional regulator
MIIPRMPSSDPNDKAERILDAALELFAERGFHGTAVPLVSERAKVGAGTIYRYFESKEALVNALYRRSKQAVIDSVLADFPLSAAPREQLASFLRRLIRFARENPAAFRFLEHHHHAPYLDARSREVEESAMVLVKGLLAETSRRGLTKNVDPTLLAALVWGGVVRLVKEAEDGKIVLDEPTLAAAEQVLWEAIRA